MPTKNIRVGLVGAGYIASWHAGVIAQIPGASVVGVSDPAMSAAKALADSHGAKAYPALGDMLADAACDAVHILTPPHLHRQHAVESLAAGAHVFVEKPFALSAADCDAINDAATAAGRLVAVNHNFLGLPSYVRLKKLVDQGLLGRIDSADICWRFPLAPLRSGPFGAWMLRSPDNLLLELGPHLYAFAIDLFGPLEDIELRVSKPISMPGGLVHYQGWSIRARAGHVDVSMTLSLVEGVDDRSVSLRGVSGAARLDLASDTLVVNRPNTADIVANALVHELSLAGQHIREGVVNAGRQLVSLNRKSPYALGFAGSIGSFYTSIGSGSPMDQRFSGQSGGRVIDAITQTVRLLPHAETPAPVLASPLAFDAPLAMVIGGTGFIGRYLTRALVAAGHRVRIASRGSANPFSDLGDRVEITPVALDDQAALLAAMSGVDTVFHLARAEASTWEGYLKNDVGVTRAIGEAAKAAGVRRFIYTGTIDSYDASDPAQTITEQTGFATGEAMERRNLYARSKALCESTLMDMHRSGNLPLVIARPGIVIGAGGPLQHWGLGRWHSAGAVRIWGQGNNVFPFVLVEDVADALVKIMQTDGVVGQSFNLIGEPMMTCRDYFDSIHRATNTRIKVVKGSLTAFYLADLMKYGLKRYALGKRNLRVPSRADWQSRAQLSAYSNAHAKQVLDWKPEKDRQRFIERMIGGKALFGF